MPQSLHQPSFAAGELSEELKRRIDLQKYSVGAEIIQNMIVLPRGGVQTRTGLQYLGEVKTSAAATILVDFVFSTTQAYVLEFGNLYMRVWKDGGIVLTTGDAIYEVVTPWATADLPDLKFEQSADTLFVTHPDYAPRTITRTDHDAWTIAEYAFVSGPLCKENDTTTTITVTKTSSPSTVVIAKDDAVTLTASAATFASGHVGSVFGIRHRAYATSYSVSMSGTGTYDSVLGKVWGEWTITINPGSSKIDEADLVFWRSMDEGATWTRFHTLVKTDSSNNVELAGSEEDPAIIKVTRAAAANSDSCTVTLDSAGKYEWACFKVTGYTSSTVVTGTAQANFDQCTVAFKTWAEGAWSAVRGYPACVGFYQDRLCFGQNATEPNSFWDSKTGDYVNMGMTLPAIDDDSIQSRLPARKVNAIHWLVPLQAQMALTSDSEWSIEPTVSGMFTASSIKMRQQSAYGCDSRVEPVVVGDLCLFVAQFGTKVRSIGYDDVNGKQQSDLSILAEHLFAGRTVVDWAYQQSPHSVLWCVMSDGKAISFTFHKEHEVWAWCRHETDGLFERVACIPGTGQDDVYFIVNRTIGGATKRYVEMLAHRVISPLSSYIGLDSSATKTGASSVTVSGLTHLIGETVTALADGIERKGLVVSAGGIITLPVAASVVQVGLPFNWRLKTLQVDASNKYTGNSADKKKLIVGASVTVLDSYGGQAGDLQFINVQYPTSTPVLYSGDIDVKIPAGWKKEGQFEIKGTGTLPMHITNLMPLVNQGGV